MNRPLLLLLGTGAMLGLNFPLGKLALAAGVQPAIWAAYISLAAGLALLGIVNFAEDARGKPTVKNLARFSIISGFVSFVMPNLLTFTVIPKLGSGLVAIMFALSPVVTAVLSVILRVRPPNLFGILGIGFGLVGAMTIVFGRNAMVDSPDRIWLVVALLIPVFLGIGNVYRTMAWPDGASPQRLASMTNLAAVPFLLSEAVFVEGHANLQALVSIPLLLVVQLAISTIMFLMFFRLQQIGGPTYLSQIGYVAAAVGVLIGVAVFGEVYPTVVWIGVAIIAFGVLLTNLAQMRRLS